MVVAVQPAHFPLGVHQAALGQSPPNHIKVHALHAVLPVGRPALTVAAVTLRRHKIPKTVELASSPDVRLLVPLEFAHLLIEDHLGLDQRVSLAMMHLDYFVDFFLVIYLGVIGDVFLFELFCADLALDLLVVTVRLVLLDLYKLPLLETVTTLHGLVVDLLTKM